MYTTVSITYSHVFLLMSGTYDLHGFRSTNELYTYTSVLSTVQASQIAAHTENGFQQIRKFFDYTVLHKVTNILLVKDHARNRMEPFCVKTIENTCATLAVGQFS